MQEAELILAPGREKSLKRRHVWIFSGAVDRVTGEPAPGATVAVKDSRGNFLARAAFSPESQITSRVWSFDPAETVDADFFRRRIAAAVEHRAFLGLDDSSGGCRLIHSEGDGLPGLIVDRYADFLIVQFLSAGTEFHREAILEALQSILMPRGIYERSDASVRAREGLPGRQGLITGEEPPNPLIIKENGVLFAVDVRHGQKSGFYFDQRGAREVLARYAPGRSVLNAFSYTGGFGVTAAVNDAEFVLNIDSSQPSLKLARHNMERNRIPESRFENRCADVFEVLRELQAEGRKFDIVVLDPPKFIDSARVMSKGCRAYQDIARLGFGLLNPGGLMMNFSCSGLMTAELFQKITADAAIEAGVEARLIRHLEQSADHPTSLAVPEGFYLKGLLSRIAT